MENIGNNYWQSSQAIPFSIENDTIQVRVIAEDVYNNTTRTIVFESGFEPPIDFTTFVIMGIILVIIIIAIVIVIRKKTK